ncbi:MAG: gluconeogenesis factor YvcK family protein [Peptococcia bacterium]
MKILPWFYPALGVKRWLLLALAGIFLIIVGIAVAYDAQLLGLLENWFTLLIINLFGFGAHRWGGVIVMAAGLVVTAFALAKAGQALIRPLAVDPKGKMKTIYQRQYLRRGPKVVVIGGGTGLSVLLRGLKEYTSNITAIVSVADDGGSSGRLRGEFGILPPGDLRDCLVALADTEPIMEKLFAYRFNGGEGLQGHNLGNLLITALADMSGSFETAINELSKVLAIRGRVLPSTLDHLILAAELVNGEIIRGESKIGQTTIPIKRVFTIPDNCVPLPKALHAIEEADAIILGPGSLYTSIIPNLLVPGIVPAIQASRAAKIYVCNVMTQHGETKGYTAADHLQAIYDHAAEDLVDYIIVNDQEIPEYFQAKYALEGAEAVEIDRERLQKLNVRVLAAPLIEEGDFIRHNPRKLAGQIMKLTLNKFSFTPFFGIVDYYILTDRISRNL